jgi:hypothetical protein
MFRVQLPPAARVVGLRGQLVVWAKSPPLTPVVAIVVIVNGPVPVLVRVKTWGTLVVPTCWFAKVSEAGDRPTAGAVPVPLRFTACGLPVALSVTVSAPVRGPTAVGVNVTLIVQLEPAGSVVGLIGQVVV